MASPYRWISTSTSTSRSSRADPGIRDVQGKILEEAREGIIDEFAE